MTTAKVYQAIAAVTQNMGQEGISKSRKNQQQGYNFRGIDDVFNALSPMLSTNNLCILPCVLERQCEERQSAKGGALFYVTVKVRFDFVSAEDGSKHEVVMYGEAMDSGDKATNKAMSAAYKYAAMQAFCIPTEGDNDADQTTHEVAPRQKITHKAGDPEPDAAILAQFNAASDIASLTKVMNALSQDDKRLYIGHFNQRMSELKKAA
tara:strand:- start:6188 stop:6811 length:624 start_codon:yes stop_codon:yes gene_type:complete